MSTIEEWRPVVGYAGFYEVSNQGRVRSLPRTAARRVKGAVPVRGRILSTYRNKGYPAVKLTVGGTGRRAQVHVLVCEAWHGPRPTGAECRHLDDNKLNVSPDNLQWGTRSENMLDRLRNGIDPNASKTHCPLGHEYSPQNTHRSPDHRRYCRTCMRIWSRRYQARKRGSVR